MFRAANVMLRTVRCIGNEVSLGLFPPKPKYLRFRISQASISTNTAINKSLRKSQYDRDRTVRQPSRRSADDERNSPTRTYKRDWVRKPNHQQAQDVQDIEQHTRINERYRELKKRRVTRTGLHHQKNLKTFAQESVAKGLTTDDTLRKAQYDYTRKAGGNRATRRAAQYGHEIELPSEDARPIASKRRAAGRQSTYGHEQLNSPSRRPRDLSGFEDEIGKGESGLSFPEELRDVSSPQLSGRAYTMGRQEPRDTESTDGYGFRSHRRESRASNDQTAMYRESEAPLSVPYTTPASEFLYGTSVVVAALLSSRRKLYKLYIYDGDNREVRDQDIKIRKLALERKVVVERVRGDWIRVMDKMSTGRPHNGYILEASPLPKVPVVGLQPVKGHKAPLHVILDHQSREEEEINGIETNIKYETGFLRYPLILLLDGILDPGNLGAILRTAFFLGVDVVAVASRSSAPISPVALKASAGATETLPLISVNQPGIFLDNCKKNGWTVYAAASPGSHKRANPNKYLSASSLRSPVQESPCILVLGGEGEGLRGDIQRKANFDIGIEGVRVGQGRVDSLNVSVAAGLLCEAFLRKPIDAEITVTETRPDLIHNEGTKDLLF